MIFYKDGRHEILNETNRLDVFGDISRWLEQHLTQAEATTEKEETNHAADND